MNKSKYLIVGGGMTADAAVNGIRELDHDGSIVMISSDTHPPYNRPPLSKALWKGKPVESIWRGTQDLKVDIRLARSVKTMNMREKTVQDDKGENFQYEKLLLATGSVTKRLPFECDEIIYYRTFDDYQKLKQLTESNKKIAVIGSGFIGSEIAAALAMQGHEVSIFEVGSGIGWNIFPKRMVAFLNEYYDSQNVKVYPQQKIVEIKKTGDGYSLLNSEEKTYTFDIVVAGVGVTPALDLAQSGGLSIGDGIIVDKYLRTSHPEVYAAGDVANFYNPLLEKNIRVEHADNANAMGKQAGRNMAGGEEKYDYLPLFYSDLFDLGYEAVGELDSRSQIVEDWQEPFQKGVLYYLQDQRVRGVLLWNVWDKVDEARQVIAIPSPVSASALIGRLK